MLPCIYNYAPVKSTNTAVHHMPMKRVLASVTAPEFDAKLVSVKAVPNHNAFSINGIQCNAVMKTINIDHTSA